MTELLHIDSSIFGSGGQSSQLGAYFLERWKAAHPDSHIVSRNLATDPVPHLDGNAVMAFMGDPDGLSDSQTEAVERSAELIGEIQKADTVVIGLPMYNFGVPSTLKAWIDHIARAGVTFQYTENGPEGLLKGKKVYVLAARGGIYQGTPADSQTPYLQAIFGLMGLDDVTFVYAEGLNMGDEAKAAALDAARRQIAELVPLDEEKDAAAA